MAATKRAQKIDQGQQEINNWVRWFIDAHHRRVADLELTQIELRARLLRCTKS